MTPRLPPSEGGGAPNSRGAPQGLQQWFRGAGAAPPTHSAPTVPSERKAEAGPTYDPDSRQVPEGAGDPSAAAARPEAWLFSKAPGGPSWPRRVRSSGRAACLALPSPWGSSRAAPPGPPSFPSHFPERNGAASRLGGGAGERKVRKVRGRRLATNSREKTGKASSSSRRPPLPLPPLEEEGGSCFPQLLYTCSCFSKYRENTHACTCVRAPLPAQALICKRLLATLPDGE